ncbi:hypothetical protein PYW08_014129 [Mythimna loreyi]|uniref:Uncharacterized protein n=1 Tax=Mythimna loreyi TaxID=667449 RepID=A0ACC2R6I5_9NEOP|nr:hypothetical protein PYW08_014129 [Mythimna loreyi]
MRELFIVMLFNSVNVIFAQFDIINEDLGDIHLYAEVGNLPLRYIPMSDDDQKASDKAAEIIDFIQIVPNIDPLILPMVQTVNIDVPFLFLSGKVNFENFFLAGVKQLQLNGLELRLINLRGDLNITIPELFVEADFSMRATLSFWPIIVDCHISVNLYEVDVAVVGGGHKEQSSAGEVLQLESAAVKVDIKDVMFNVTNLVLGETLGDDVEGYTPTKLSSRISESNTADSEILNGLLSKALDIANKELSNVPIEAFMDYLLSDTF